MNFMLMLHALTMKHQLHKVHLLQWKFLTSLSQYLWWAKFSLIFLGINQIMFHTPWLFNRIVKWVWNVSTSKVSTQVIQVYTSDSMTQLPLIPLIFENVSQMSCLCLLMHNWSDNRHLAIKFNKGKLNPYNLFISQLSDVNYIYFVAALVSGGGYLKLRQPSMVIVNCN